MKSCPNINSPEWDAFKKKHGKRVWEMYARNNYEVPTISNKKQNSEFG